MKKTHKVSNSVLVYTTGFLLMLMFIFGVFAVINVVKEANQIGFIRSVLENAAPTVLGVICLLLVSPGYRLTKSLRILEMTDYEKGPAILSLYPPLFADDMPEADRRISIKNLKGVSQNTYFNRLVELYFDVNGTERNVKSFVGPKAIERMKEA